MKKAVLALIILAECTGCASLMDYFKRHDEVAPPVVTTAPAAVDNSPKRTTRKSLEEQSMLGEEAGSLWVGRGQASYLFTNNNLRLIGDILPVKIEGYPKEQIQTKANVISKLLAEILNEQRQEIKLKQDELKKQMEPDPAKEQEQSNFLQRGLASVGTKDNPTEAPPDPAVELKKSEKQLAKITEEESEIKDLQKAKEFPIRSIVTHVIEIQKDGNYRVKGEQPFMIGKREYRLLVMGTVRAEQYEEKGISAEILVDPVFDIISEKKSGDL
jgi:flagellar L-ring protein FlgH